MTEQGTFPMKNAGVDNDPDFYSGPDKIATGEMAIVIALVSQASPNTTVKFKRRTKTPVEKNESLLFSAAADNLLTTLDGGSLPTEPKQAKLLAFIIRWMRKQEGTL